MSNYCTAEDVLIGTAEQDILIDVSGLSPDQLDADVGESGLGLALRRIFAPREEGTQHEFSSTI